jgi:hypothetical protein
MDHVTTTLRGYVAELTDRLDREEDGFSTAELLGNAALGILALVVIWTALQALGVNVVEMISDSLLGGGA